MRPPHGPGDRPQGGVREPVVGAAAHALDDARTQRDVPVVRRASAHRARARRPQLVRHPARRPGLAVAAARTALGLPPGPNPRHHVHVRARPPGRRRPRRVCRRFRRRPRRSRPSQLSRQPLPPHPWSPCLRYRRLRRPCRRHGAAHAPFAVAQVTRRHARPVAPPSPHVSHRRLIAQSRLHRIRRDGHHSLQCRGCRVLHPIVGVPHCRLLSQPLLQPTRARLLATPPLPCLPSVLHVQLCRPAPSSPVSLLVHLGTAVLVSFCRKFLSSF
mmetsp:Transcript_29/g.73  ORF Transcript_29/g.73 Transcript_29/m.73 type:complete len:272 (+) Transcript_29:745-1560(+)